LAISLIVSLLGLAAPYVNAQLYGTVIPSGIKSNILSLGFLLLGTAIGSMLFSLSRSPVRSAARKKTGGTRCFAIIFPPTATIKRSTGPSNASPADGR